MGNYYSRGLTVKEDTEIDISSQKLTSLPVDLTQEIYAFVKLQQLNASNNQLSTVLGIRRLATLLDLNVEHNQLKQFEEDLLQLVALQKLNVSYNQISHIPEDIRSLKNLKELKCDNNKLTSISAEVYHLSNLTLLNLSCNQLDIYPSEISLLSRLKHLDLHANRILSIPTSAFAHCAALTHVNLSHNALRELPAKLFDCVPHLVKLYVSHNQIKQLPNLDKLAELREVDVSYNRLERVPQFKQRLTFVDISHNPATAAASKAQEKEREKEREKATAGEEPINLTKEVPKGKRLFHITGHSYTRAIIYMVEHTWRLPDMGYYMLDNITSVLLWEAHRCAPATREIAHLIAKEYAKEYNIKELSTCNADYPGDFWQQIQMQNPFAQSRSPLPKKKDYYLDYVMQLKLFCIAEDLRGEIHIDLQAGKRPYHHQLDSACCYVMDSGWDIFVWVGTETSPKQRQHALLKADELMDYPRTSLSCIQWQFEGDEHVLFKEQFLNWNEGDVKVDIPVEPVTKEERSMSSLKRRHDTLVKKPDADFGTFPEIKVVQSKKKRSQGKKIKIVVKEPVARPPTPDKAKLVPDLPLKSLLQPNTASRSMLSFAEKPALPKASRAPSQNPIRDRQTRHLAHEKVSPRPDKSPRSGGLVVGSPEDLKKIQLKATGVALYGAEEGKNNQEAVGPRLIQFQGRRSFLGKRLRPVSASIVLGSAYLLDTGKHGKIYIWADKTASRTSKGAALALAKALRDKERPDSLVVNIEIGGDDSEFWKELGGKVALADIPVDEADSDTTSRDHIYLHKVKNTKEGFQLTTEASGSDIKKEMLDSNAVYVVDADTEIYVWLGKHAAKVDKDAGIKFAEEIEKEKEGWCAPISKEYETTEQVLFREKFIDWGGSIPISMQQVPVGVNVAAPRKQVKIDVNQMFVRKAAKEEPMADDGSGKIKIWRVQDYEKVDAREGDPGTFYAGDAYVILYTYIWKNVERYIIYFYQGRDATINDAGAAALLTVGLDDELNRQAKEVRVVQGKEPKHFLTIFKGSLMIHQGQDPLGDGTKYEGTAMYDVRGNNDLNIKAIQVYPSADMLHHCHVFIVLSNKYKKDGVNFIWCGNKSTECERNFAQVLLQNQGYTKVQVIEQGHENQKFWDLLGGKSIFYDKNPTIRVEPHLFQCSEASGLVTIEEINNFYQDDLDGHDVMVLDAFSEMYVWAGKMSTEGERKAAMQICVEYAAAAINVAGRPKSITSYYMREGDETLQFATHFQGYQWTPRHRMASFAMADPLDFPPVLKPLKLVTELMDQYDKTYTYQELLDKKYPRGLDGSKLESYLSDKEFEEVFAVTKPEFEAYPLWKKEGIKKELGLF